MTKVYTSGVFDLFHVGHLSVFKKAKQFGDYLIVGVHSDQDVESYKRTPIISCEQRGWKQASAFLILMMRCNS